jgi:hypothetical protein
MSARRSNDDADSAAAVLEHLAKQAVDTAKKARKHRASLSGDNFYGNKLANLRLGAARAFEEFAAQSTGNAAAVAELIGAIFDPSTAQRERLNAYRELSFSLQTTWRKASANPLPQGTESFFPALDFGASQSRLHFLYRSPDERLLYGRMPRRLLGADAETFRNRHH